MNQGAAGSRSAFYPSGDPNGEGDGYPGSLFTAGHAHDDYAGEISIPAPAAAQSIADLPRARVLQAPADITGGWKDNCSFHPDCLYRELDGLVYLPNINKMAWNLRDWFNTAKYDQDSLGWSSLDMTDAQGVWHIGPRNDDADLYHNAKTSNFLFKAPESFAAQWLNNKWLIAGGTREAGALGGSQGPSLFALAPWEDGNPPASSACLDALPLVYYPEIVDCVWKSTEGQGVVYPKNNDVCVYPDYRAVDAWNGGAWVEADSGTAILITGKKGLGDNCYAAGEVCNDPCMESKGYHAYPYDPQILFYDPEHIKEVISGTRQPWQVLPCSIMSIKDIFYDECGVIGAASWDSGGRHLFITEKEVNDPDNGFWGKTIVHVWTIH
ncbi:MAG: hypothetical protein U9P10_13970 [Thermodesulfobacteriota bacterium]|nr:hypothetical protein [Thermodesulfobacteriota bacterium]